MAGRQQHLPDRPYGFPPEAFDTSCLPDVDHEFVTQEDLDAFAQALQAPDTGPQSPTPTPGPDDGNRSPGWRGSFASMDVTKRSSQVGMLLDDTATSSAVAAQAAAASGDVQAPGLASTGPGLFITAQNDWAPVNERVYRRGSKRRRKITKNGGKAAASSTKATTAPRSRLRGFLGERTKDETREGWLYMLLRWPILFLAGGWLAGLGAAYLFTRLYIWIYEQFVTWRGRREKLRRNMRATNNYADWVAAAKELDAYLGRQRWKEENEFAYYDSRTVRRVWEQIRKYRLKAEEEEEGDESAGNGKHKFSSSDDKAPAVRRPAAEDLRVLIEACVKNNFVGVENPRLYSQTYYGTKNLVQNFIDEVEASVSFLSTTKQLDQAQKRALFKRMHANYGRTALCLSGGAAFAYYHLGVVRALLDADLLPDVITGTSGGALIAALVATRTNDELKQLLVPALSERIKACSEPFTVWIPRWWRTGARFDSLDWARQCSWWTRGSMTFREAYERTGRILNVSCVPADPHSPTILCNYLTSPDCVIWSAVLASAAVPGILNPVVLMMKTGDGRMVPYSFGHKWKDGSLRTDIPIKALNLHFNVNFTIVSQVNPHVNLFFFSSRGSVGHPVTHRKGRGWRGGYLMSAFEHYLKLDMNKWLRFVRHAELLPRPLGQDWSQLWLQQFSGTITIWPKSVVSDFWHILSDPDPPRLARMLHEGQQSAFPKLKFVANRLKVERLVEKGRLETRPWVRRGSIETILSEDDLRSLLVQEGKIGSSGAGSASGGDSLTQSEESALSDNEEAIVDGEAEEEKALLMGLNLGGDSARDVQRDEDAVPPEEQLR